MESTGVNNHVFIRSGHALEKTLGARQGIKRISPAVHHQERRSHLMPKAIDVFHHHERLHPKPRRDGFQHKGICSEFRLDLRITGESGVDTVANSNRKSGPKCGKDPRQ